MLYENSFVLKKETPKDCLYGSLWGLLLVLIYFTMLNDIP